VALANKDRQQQEALPQLTQPSPVALRFPLSFSLAGDRLALDGIRVHWRSRDFFVPRLLETGFDALSVVTERP